MERHPPHERALVAPGDHEDEVQLVVLGVLGGVAGRVDLGYPESPAPLEHLDEVCGPIRLIKVLHVQDEAHVVLVQEYRAEDEYQDYRERNREEHCGLLAGEALEAHDEICTDDTRAHSGILSTGSSRSASPVSFMKTSSRLGLRTSKLRSDTPASVMAFSTFWTSPVCSTLTLMFLWFSCWTGDVPENQPVPTR